MATFRNYWNQATIDYRCLRYYQWSSGYCKLQLQWVIADTNFWNHRQLTALTCVGTGRGPK